MTIKVLTLYLLDAGHILLKQNTKHNSSKLQLVRRLSYNLDSIKDDENSKTTPIEANGTQSKTSDKTRSTIDENEINKFRVLADSWWDREGDFKPLHSLNKLRVALIRNGLLQSGLAKAEFCNGPYPLSGLSILDVGCGGGILCEPLARLGATVTGLDAAEESVAVAKIHAKNYLGEKYKVDYIQGTIEDHAATLENKYDAVIASEVVEHVAIVDYFVESCTSIIKPGGSFFVTTINKTLQSKLAAICLAEYLLRLVPVGTHDWNKFVPQRDLRFMLEKYNCSVRLIHGMMYIPLRNEWFWAKDSSVNYALHAIKSAKVT